MSFNSDAETAARDSGWVSALSRFTHRLCAAIRVLAGTLLIASVLINSANIIGRYLLARPVQWAEEVMLFLMIGFVFIGNGLVSYADRQIRMDVIVAMLPQPMRRALKLVSDLAFIAVAILISIYAFPAIQMLWQFDERSTAANLPVFIPQAAIPIGLLLSAFLIAMRLLIRPKNEPPTSEH